GLVRRVHCRVVAFEMGEIDTRKRDSIEPAAAAGQNAFEVFDHPARLCFDAVRQWRAVVVRNLRAPAEVLPLNRATLCSQPRKRQVPPHGAFSFPLDIAPKESERPLPAGRSRFRQAIPTQPGPFCRLVRTELRTLRPPLT